MEILFCIICFVVGIAIGSIPTIIRKAKEAKQRREREEAYQRAKERVFGK